VCATPIVPRHARQVTCGAARCREARSYGLERQDPRRIEAERARLRARQATTTNPVLRGAPAYGPHLPGRACALVWTPAVAVDLDRARHLHHALTMVLGRDHNPTRPDWALRPWGRGWAVYWYDAADEARVRAAGPRSLVLGTDRVTLGLDPTRHAPRAPVVPRRGWHRLRLDALTPVVIRTMAGRVTHTRPTAAHLVSTLAMLAQRLGVAVPPEALAVEVVAHETAPAVTPVRGKLGGDGRIRGWTGAVVLRCNAPARWLLEAAARGPGLGGRVAYGFGAVRVTEGPA
jgi:hypothetical protein